MNRTLACAALNWSMGSEEEAVKEINIDLLGLMLNHSMSRPEAALALTAALASDGGCWEEEAEKGRGGSNLAHMSLPTISEH